MTYREEMRRLRRLVLRRRIEEADGNIAEAARRATLNRTHFYKLMQRCGMKTPAPHRGNWAELQ